MDNNQNNNGVTNVTPSTEYTNNNESPQNVKYCPKCGNKVDQSATTCFMC